MEKFYMNKSDMKKAYRNMGKKSLEEKEKLSIEIKREKFKKTAMVLFVLLFLFTLFKLTIKEIYIPVNLSYTKSRGYNITINDEKVGYNVIEFQKIPIVPLVLYLPARAETNMFEEQMKLELGSKIFLNIKSFSCYSKFDSKEVTRMCSALSECRDCYTKEIEDTIKYNLEITEYRTGRVIYDGILTSDIGSYFKKSGRYNINIKGRYNFVDVNIYTSLLIK